MLLVGMSEGKTPLGRRRRSMDGWKMDLEDRGIDWIGLAQDRDK
jgi:hypothetical protein